MTYEAWRCTFQSAEQAALAAYSRVEELARRVAELEADQRRVSDMVNKAWSDGKAEGHGDATAEASVVIGELRARVAELEAWRNAVLDELVTLNVASKKHEDDPKFAVRDCINYNMQLALDPAISSQAQELIDRGRAEERAEREWQKPAFWYRPRSDGLGYDGPIHDSQIEPVRRTSGAWVPLYAGPLPSQSAAALVGLRGCNSLHGGAREPDPCVYRYLMRTTDTGCTGCAERGEDQAAEAGGSIQGEPQ